MDRKPAFIEINVGCPEIECLMWRALIYREFMTAKSRGERVYNLCARLDLTKHELRKIVRCIELWMRRENLLSPEAPTAERLEALKQIQSIWTKRWRDNAKPMVM